MKRLLGILAALLLLPCSALAQTATTYQLTDSGSTVHQVRGWTCQTSQLCLAYVPVDYTGSVFGVSANPFFVAPGAGATFPVSGTVSCSNCSGSGVSATFGGAIGSNGTPGGFKDTGGLFQPFLGDANGLWVNIKAAAAIGVTGTFWQATQPVSIASMPTTPVTGTFWPYALGQQVSGSSVPVVLPAAQITALTPPTSVGISGSLPGFASAPTFNCGTGCFQATQPVSAASLPLPSGAATSANQSTIITALGTLNTTAGNPLAAGTAIIGKVGIDQTTPGTTNNVTVSPLPAAARNFPGCTVGASSAQCLAAATAVKFLQVQNTSASASVACAFGATAVLNSSTSVQLAAGQSASWGPNTSGVPSGAMNCIASGASTPLYVEWN